MSMAEKLQQSGGSFLASVREAASENPIAAALIGAGALWLLTGRPAAKLARGGATLVGAVDHGEKSALNARQAPGSIRDAAATSGGRLKERSATMRRQVVDQLNAGVDGVASARAQLAAMFEKQPLALGAVGLAIGAAVAASLPTTRMEEGAFGATSDELRERARAAADAAAEEAREQNLTPEGLTDDIENAASKVADVSEKAAEAFRENVAPSS